MIETLSPESLIVGSLLALDNHPIFTLSKTVLVVSSTTVAKNEKIKTFIQNISEKYHVDVFTEIKPDAPIDILDALVSNITKPDVIVAIGGGSVIDSAKALSVAWNQASILDLFYKKAEIGDTKIPTIAVPTTAGTGAELSFGAILYDKANKFKSGLRGSILRPNLAFIDVDLYATAPPKLIAEVGFDCLTHAIETYLSTASTPMVRYQSVAAIQTVFQNLVAAYKGDRGALEKVAIAAALMGINLAESTTCLPHRIQYALGPKTDTSHAQGLIMLYKGWLNSIDSTSAFAELASDLDLTISELKSKIQHLKTLLNIDYSLSDYGVTEESIFEIANDVTGNMANDPCFKSKETIITILRNSL